MEINNVEICKLEDAVKEGEVQMRELMLSQLALVGGGAGDVSFT